MIYSNFKNKQGLRINGTIDEVSAQCILIMKEIFLRNKEQYGYNIAKSILINMLLKAIKPDLKKEDLEE